jgi:hypothetical protein
VQGCHSLLDVWLKRMSLTGDSCICQKEIRGGTVSFNEDVKGGSAVPFVFVPRELDSWCSWCSGAHVHIQSTTTSVPAKEGQLRAAVVHSR